MVSTILHITVHLRRASILQILSRKNIEIIFYQSSLYWHFSVFNILCIRYLKELFSLPHFGLPNSQLLFFKYILKCKLTWESKLNGSIPAKPKYVLITENPVNWFNQSPCQVPSRFCSKCLMKTKLILEELETIRLVFQKPINKYLFDFSCQASNSYSNSFGMEK